MTERCLCFDFDGTLVDSSLDIRRAVNELRTDLGLPERDLHEVRAAIGRGTHELMEKLFPEEVGMEPGELVQAFRDVYERRCVENVHGYTSLEDLFDRLPPSKRAIVTNKPLSMTRNMLRTAGWSGYFDPVFGADSFPRQKPDPLPLEQVARQWNVPPGDLVMIGDNWTDVRAGKALGAVTVGCEYGFGDSRRLKQENPDHLIRSLDELEELLPTLGQ